MNRAELVKRIADLVNDKEITEISDVRDESDERTRVVIELKRDANAKVVINKLYKMTGDGDVRSPSTSSPSTA